MKELLRRSLRFWRELPEQEKNFLLQNTILRKQKKGQRLSYGTCNCSGINIVKSGRVRIFLNAPSGAELTLYRLLPGEVCVLSAACMLKSLDFEVYVEYEKDTEICVVPQEVYRQLCDRQIQVKAFTLDLLSHRFTDVIRLLGEVAFSSMEKRMRSKSLRAMLTSQTAAGIQEPVFTVRLICMLGKRNIFR